MMSDHFSLQDMLIHNKLISAQILINTSVINYAFIDSSFTHKHQFLTELIHILLNLKAFNDQNAGQITHTITLSMFIPKELIQHTLFLVTELSKQNIILDYPWLQAHDAIIDCS